MINEKIQSILNKNTSINDSWIFLTKISFRLKEIDQSITIVYYENSTTGHVLFDQSHYIKTPTQSTGYSTDKYIRNNLDEAVRASIETITNYYEEAIRFNHKPEESWLVRNESFIG